MKKNIEYKEYVLDFIYDLEDLILSRNTDKAYSFIAKYDEAKTIISCAINTGIDIKLIEFSDESLNGYDKEYLVELYEDGLYVEPAWRKQTNGYIMTDTDILMLVNINDNKEEIIKPQSYDKCINIALLEDSNEFEDYSLAELLEKIENEDEEDKCLECCDCCCSENYIQLSKDINGELKGFTMSGGNGKSYWSKSFYCNDEKMVKEMLESWK